MSRKAQGYGLKPVTTYNFCFTNAYHTITSYGSLVAIDYIKIKNKCVLV